MRRRFVLSSCVLGGLMILRRFAVVLMMLLAVSTCALAQKADIAFVIGGAFASDTKVQTVGSVVDNVKTGHKVFYADNLAYRVANLKVASFHFELQVAGVSSAAVSLPNTATL